MVGPCPAERDAQLRVGFVGAGKVGFTLGCHIRDHGGCISGYASRSPHTAREAAHITGSAAFPTLRALLDSSDLIFITTPDAAIEDAAARLAACAADDAPRTSGSAGPAAAAAPAPAAGPLSGKIVCHCSGMLAADVLEPARAAGAACASVHPLAAVNGTPAAPEVLGQAFFTLEGDPAAVRAAGTLLAQCGNRFRTIDAADKVRYHASAVLLSNLVCALAGEGLALLEQCGFTPDEAREAAAPLFLGNCAAVARDGPARALTGPIERGDAATVEAHLAALPGPTRRLYAALSLSACDLARVRHPDRPYATIRTLLAESI